MSNLLVVDWDYFFPTPEGKPNATTEEFFLYDWGHSEGWGGPLENAMWMNRAQTFDMNNLPRPTMNDEWVNWWDRFDVEDGTTLFYADSNVQAYSSQVHGGVKAVWLYDAHHDSGYGRPLADIKESGRVSCEDWMVAYHLDGVKELHVRYPRWKPWAMDEQEPSIEVDRQIDDFEDNPVHFSHIFVCRSGAWVPPWCDDDFQSFVFDAPVAEVYELTACEPRGWDDEAVRQHGEMVKALMKNATS